MGQNPYGKQPRCVTTASKPKSQPARQPGSQQPKMQPAIGSKPAIGLAKEGAQPIPPQAVSQPAAERADRPLPPVLPLCKLTGLEFPIYAFRVPAFYCARSSLSSISMANCNNDQDSEYRIAY